MNLPAGTENPRSWKATKDTTYPGYGMGKSSAPGLRHSSASVNGGSNPADARPYSCAWVTKD